jgi:TRAP-type C4-dicarboxylate transport system substrate-binding protein
MRKMVRYSTIISVALALAVGLVLGSAIPSNAAAPIKLKFQGKWEGHEKQNWANEQLKFADRVKAATKGGVEIENLGEVVNDDEVIDAVRKGVEDMGSQAIHSRGELSLLNFISIPAVQFDKMPEMYGKLRPYLGNWMETQFPDLKVIGYTYFLPNNIYTNKPCTTLEDIRKMKLRITGNLLVQVVKAAGGNPITMTVDEVYQAVQRGILDGGQTAPPGYLSTATYEVCKYMSSWPLGGNALVVTMYKPSWNKMDATLQGQFMSAWMETEKAQVAGIYRDLDDIEKQCIAKGSIRMNPSQAEKDKFAAFAGVAVKDWRSKVGPDGDPVIKAVNETLGTKF